MPLKLLKLVFKIGGLFAMSPARIEKNGLVFPSKAYSLLWIILLSAGISVTAVYRTTSYKTLSTIGLMLQASTDVILFILNISTILVTVTKKYEWNKFIDVLKILRNGSEDMNVFWFTPFLATNVVFVIIMIYETYLVIQIIGPDFFNLYAIEYFQLYAQFIVYSMIYSCLNMILDSIQNISKAINSLKPNRLNSFLLKQIKSDFRALSQCVEIFNNIFGWLILLLIGFTFFELLRSVQVMIMGTRNTTVATVIIRSMFIIWLMVSFQIASNKILLRSLRSGRLTVFSSVIQLSKKL
uniref:Gustatory receptor n=1 Tax=Tribolium castaneum TaxID=7070 RepID=B8PUL3_TRICA|nr:gustatory receptor [Tribolium castaneum]